MAPAAEKEAQLRRKKGISSQAEVGRDYSDQPCPTSDARRVNATSQPAQGKTQFDSKHEQLHGSEQVNQPTPAGNDQGGCEQGAKQTGTGAGTADADADAGGGVGWRQKVKGEAKMLSGKITRNADKVDLGREIKAGGGGGGGGQV